MPYPDSNASAYADERVNPLFGALVPLVAAVLSLLVTIAIYRQMT